MPRPAPRSCWRRRRSTGATMPVSDHSPSGPVPPATSRAATTTATTTRRPRSARGRSPCSSERTARSTATSSSPRKPNSGTKQRPGDPLTRQAQISAGRARSLDLLAARRSRRQGDHGPVRCVQRVKLYLSLVARSGSRHICASEAQRVVARRHALAPDARSPRSFSPA